MYNQLRILRRDNSGITPMIYFSRNCRLCSLNMTGQKKYYCNRTQVQSRLALISWCHPICLPLSTCLSSLSYQNKSKKAKKNIYLKTIVPSYLSYELDRAFRRLQTLQGFICLQHYTLTRLKHKRGLLDPQDGNQESVGVYNHVNPVLRLQQRIHKYLHFNIINKVSQLLMSKNTVTLFE